MAVYTYPKYPELLNNGDSIIFDYTGDVQKLPASTLLIAEKLKIECWGAQGGDGGAKGGYSYGEIKASDIVSATANLYFCVGEGNSSNGGGKGGIGHPEYGTFGGGGASDGGDGGGASDVRTYYDENATDFILAKRGITKDKKTLCITSLKSRIIVAGGGGGADHAGRKQGGGGAGGGWAGGSGRGGGGSQTSGGSGSDGSESGFGYGSASYDGASAGGGGGLYGGGASDGGGGGSSYVSGNANCSFSTSSGLKFTNSGTEAGVRLGHGRIVLTVISGESLTKYNKSLYYYNKSKNTTSKINLYHYKSSVVSKIKCAQAYIASDNTHVIAVNNSRATDNALRFLCKNSIFKFIPS